MKFDDRHIVQVENKLTTKHYANRTKNKTNEFLGCNFLDVYDHCPDNKFTKTDTDSYQCITYVDSIICDSMHVTPRFLLYDKLIFGSRFKRR